MPAFNRASLLPSVLEISHLVPIQRLKLIEQNEIVDFNTFWQKYMNIDCIDVTNAEQEMLAFPGHLISLHLCGGFVSFRLFVPFLLDVRNINLDIWYFNFTYNLGATLILNRSKIL